MKFDDCIDETMSKFCRSLSYLHTLNILYSLKGVKYKMSLEPYRSIFFNANKALKLACFVKGVSYIVPLFWGNFVTLIGEVTKTPQLHNSSEIVNMYSWSAVNATNLPICGKTFPLCRIFLPHLVTKLLMFAICSPCKISVVPAQD